ncbi:MAG: hypothetical protein ACP5QT_08780 [Brevinematia bacterium]
MSRDRLTLAIITTIVLLIFLSLVTFINRKEKKLEKELVSASSSSSSSSIAVIEQKPFGKVLKIKGQKAVIIRKNLKEEILDKKLIFPDSTLITEDTKLVISNKESTIVVDPGTRIYVGSNSLVQDGGEMEIDGKINIKVNGYRISGEGRIVIKSKENEVHIAQYKGSSKIRKNTNTVELGEGEGIILYRDSFEPPFKLPAAPGEIKVKVY